jgi:pimeloyl-ACP methyl ester carboxylesterase
MNPRSIFLFIILYSQIVITGYSQQGTVKAFFGPVTIAKEVIYDSLLSVAGNLSSDLIEKVVHADYDVEAYKIIYITSDLQGNPVDASGALFIPKNLATANPFVTYLHGTLTRNTDAPSNLSGAETIIGWMFAMNGYITLMPDYLGMGDGTGVHPYLHKQTEATATTDMIKAVKTFLQQHSIPFINDLYLCGYSQGGHAAVATQQYIESQPESGVNLKINVAGSGPYYLSLIQKKFVFSNENYDNASFLPYLLLGYQAAYGNLYESLSQVFIAPYDAQIPGLFDGMRTVDEIDSFLPSSWKNMFQTSYLSGITANYFHPVNRALRANDLIRWRPQAKLRLFYTLTDELVDKDNSIAAWLTYILQGAKDVVALPVGSYKHAEAAVYVVFLAKSNFDCISGVNPCLVSTGEKSTGNVTTDKTNEFVELLKEENKPDPWQFLSDSQYAWLLSEKVMPALQNDLTVFPQPASERAYLELEPVKGEKITIRCYDFTGRLVSIQKNIVASGLYEIDCHSLTAGVYTLLIEGSIVYKTKLIVIKPRFVINPIF